MDSRNSAASFALQPPASFLNDAAGGVLSFLFNPVCRYIMSKINRLRDFPVVFAILRILRSTSGSIPRKVIWGISHLLTYNDLLYASNNRESSSYLNLVWKRVLPALAQAERGDIRRLAAYPVGTAGVVMTSEYDVLPPGLTTAEAIDKLRSGAPDKETIYYWISPVVDWSGGRYCPMAAGVL
jgi:hypothetical protein